MPPRAKTVSLEEIADAFGVTTETIRLWRKDGMPSRQESGRPRFVVRECIAWRRERDARELEATDEGPSESKEKALKIRAERLLKELELADKSRQLVPIGESTGFIEEFMASFAATAAGRLQRFEREIVRAKTPAAARRVTRAIHIALMEGGQEFAEGLERAALKEEQTAAEPDRPTDRPNRPTDRPNRSKKQAAKKPSPVPRTRAKKGKSPTRRKGGS